MRTLRFGRYAIGFCLAIAVLSGCALRQTQGDVQPAVPSSLAPSGSEQSWMAPESQSSDLLYVSLEFSGVTNVYTYPGGKPAGGLTNTGYTFGLCSDKNGNVFITTQYAIYEYPHGLAVPVATLTDPQGQPYSCSIDRATGKLAVGSNGGVAVYSPAGHNQWYLPRLFNFQSGVTSCTYDSAGNLFALSGAYSNKPHFSMLPRGGSRFVPISLNRNIPKPGNLEWDGKYLAVGSQHLFVHRFVIHGAQGTQIGLVRLNGASDLYQFWIEGSTIIGPTFNTYSSVGFWRYPHAGSVIKTIKASGHAYGATVSLAPH
jgi:hypothetical protein